MKEFIEKIANTALYPTKQEFWDLVYEARKILENERNNKFIRNS